MTRLPALVLAVLAMMTVLPTPISGFPLQDERSPGAMAVGFEKRSNFWSSFDLGIMDGKITTSPPDSTKYDRRLESAADAGFDLAFAKRFGFRFNSRAEWSRARQSDESEPRVTVDESKALYKPSADMTFVTDKGLELFGGVMAEMTPAYSQTVTSGNGESKTNFKTSLVQTRRFGAVRRAGSWSGGFYYVMSAEESRKLEQTAFDGSGIEDEETIFIPSRVGVVGAFKAGPADWDFELAFVQARGLGPKDDSGNTTYSDYFEGRIGGTFAVASGFGLRLAGAHKTLSYASSAFVTMETIPFSTLEGLVVFGDRNTHFFLGMIGGYGKDGQSLPEFNATYEAWGGAVTSGVRFPL